MMTDAELKRCLNDYECESLPQMLREVAAQSKWCTTVEGGRIPTWPLHEAAERLEAISALPPQGDGWQDIATAPRDASRDVIAERQRQISAEGWTQEHDDEHGRGQMAMAAACYAVSDKIGSINRSPYYALLWPWDEQWWKPKDRRRDLVRAGALILAEIERLDRAAPPAAEIERRGK